MPTILENGSATVNLTDRLAEQLATAVNAAGNPAMGWFVRGCWDGLHAQPIDRAGIYQADYLRGYDAGKLQDSEGTP